MTNNIEGSSHFMKRFRKTRWYNVLSFVVILGGIIAGGEISEVIGLETDRIFDWGFLVRLASSIVFIICFDLLCQAIYFAFFARDGSGC